MKKRLVFSMLAACSLVVAETAQNPQTAQKSDTVALKDIAAPGNVGIAGSNYVIPNAPIIAPSKILTLEAVGMGVFPEKGISYAHRLAMAKRAAMIDAYRQMGEKMHGVRIEAKESTRDMVLQSSVIRTHLLSLVKNANVTETKCEEDLCQVRMEVKIDGDRFYEVLTGRKI